MKTNTKNRRVRGPARGNAPAGEATSHEIPSQAASVPAAAEAAPTAEYAAFYELQALLRTRLDAPLFRLVGDLTGVRLHVLWHAPLDCRGSSAMPVICPRARQRAGANREQPTRCASCWQQRWKPSQSPAGQAHPFNGLCGLTNFSACLQLGAVRPLTLAMQARIADKSIAGSPDSAVIAARTKRRAGGARSHEQSAFLHDFQHAVALVRLILHDLESTGQAWLATSAAEHPAHLLNHPDGKATRLDREFLHPLAAPPKPAVESGPRNRAQRLVEAMCDYVQQHYRRPFGLEELASAMHMNASYLSALFSQTTGVTFHQHLEEVRLAKARELLRDPRFRIGEVASATGYASPDAFRHAFKAHEHHSPESWRAGQ